MDVLFFLKDRTKFIRYFYNTAGEPFRETMRKDVRLDGPASACVTRQAIRGYQGSRNTRRLAGRAHGRRMSLSYSPFVGQILG